MIYYYKILFQTLAIMKTVKTILLLLGLFLVTNTFSQGTWCCYEGLRFNIVSSENAKSESDAIDVLKLQTSYLDLDFRDVTANSPIPQGSGIVVTVTFSNVLIRGIVIQKYERFGAFGNSVSTRWGIAYYNNIKAQIQAVNKGYNGSNYETLRIPLETNVGTITKTDKLLNDHYTYTFKTYIQQFDAVIEVRAKNYEKRTITLTQVTPPHSENVALVQQIDNVNLSGTVNINNLSNDNNKTEKANNLDILTPNQIADALGLKESDVMELIKSQKLKSKIIGGKYFIRKEDFDEFMKK
jgi:excisionase family DNA binding protein